MIEHLKLTSAKNIGLFAGPIAALILFIWLDLLGIDRSISYTLSITSLTAIWWISEALPIPATSLVPFVLFPLFGVLSQRDAALGLGSYIILLLMGGCMIAKGLEKSNLHKRIALGILNSIGSQGGKRLIFAFMLSSAVLSMWISNTATALILMPIGLAAVKQIEDKRLVTPVILGIAFGCNIGGMGTLIGTPPNNVFAAIYSEITNLEFGFLRWMKTGLPIIIIGLPLCALWLGRNISSGKPTTLPTAGVWQAPEKRVMAVFGLIILLWVFRSQPFGGWSGVLGISTMGDASVALFGVVLMFLIPSGSGQGDRLLDWETASDIPWGMLLLFASGITIAKAFQVSGAAEWISLGLHSVTNLHPFVLIFAICLSVTFLTEFTSNTATATLLMPILAALAAPASLPIEVLMIPAAISSSCAFMLPVATAPNAIAFGTGLISIKEMMREGFVINLFMSVVISGVCYLTLL